MGFILGWTFEHRRFDLQLLTSKLRHFICCCPCYQSRIIILQVSLKSVYGSFFLDEMLEDKDTIAYSVERESDKTP